MTQRWSVCCYLHSLLPDQLFKPGVVICFEVPSQFTTGRENRIHNLPLSASLTPPSIAFLSGVCMIGACTCRSSITSKFDWEAHFYLILIYFSLSLMAPSLWPHAYVVLDRWRLIGETEVLQALCSIHSASLHLSSRISKSSFNWHNANICPFRYHNWGKEERGEKGGDEGGVGACSLTYRHIQIISRMISCWIRHSKHSRNMHIYVSGSHILRAGLSFWCIFGIWY